jgi:bifunctional non-homologous end joining protein LigD
VRLLSRKGNDLSYRFPTIMIAIAKLPVRSCLIDVCDENGLAIFDLIRGYRGGHAATLCAFDLVEMAGHDLRRKPIEERKQLLKAIVKNAHPSIAYNRHFDVEGRIVFHHAVKLGCEGIVSKRVGSPYRPGRSGDWIKVKNPAAPAVKREAGEDWRTMGKRSR